MTLIIPSTMIKAPNPTIPTIIKISNPIMYDVGLWHLQARSIVAVDPVVSVLSVLVPGFDDSTVERGFVDSAFWMSDSYTC